MFIGQMVIDRIYKDFAAGYSRGRANAVAAYGRVGMTAPPSDKVSNDNAGSQIARLMRAMMGRSPTVRTMPFSRDVVVLKSALEADQVHTYMSEFESLGREAGEVQYRMMFELLRDGFHARCYDERPFFDDKHPVLDAAGKKRSVSNMQPGNGPAWFLLDCSQPLKAIVYQEPKRFNNLHPKFDINRDPGTGQQWPEEMPFGVDGEATATYGFWQAAFASRAPLSVDNYAAARAALMSQRDDDGQPIPLNPDTLIVCPAQEREAFALVQSTTRMVSEFEGKKLTAPLVVANEWHNTAAPVVTPWVAA